MREHGRAWTIEERDAHAERMTRLHRDPAVKAAIEAKREARANFRLAPFFDDRELDLGFVPPALHDDVLAAPPVFELFGGGSSGRLD